MKRIFVLVLSLVMAGCTSSSSYQSDRPPQERDTYEGIGSVERFMKDRAYMLDYELEQKCTESKVSLMKARADKSSTEIEHFSAAVKRFCRNKPI
jgi:hypothetical protein